MDKRTVRIDSGTGSNGLRLTFIDDVSGLVIFRTTLSHEDLGKVVMGYTGMEIYEAQVADSRTVGHFGKQEHCFTRHFRATDLTVLEGVRTGNVPALDAWATLVRAQCWAQRSSWRVNNSQTIIFSMTRYENGLTSEMASTVQECLDGRDAPEGLVAK